MRRCSARVLVIAVTIGLAGCGQMGTDLVVQLRRMPGLRLGAIAEMRPPQAKAAAAMARAVESHWDDAIPVGIDGYGGFDDAGTSYGEGMFGSTASIQLPATCQRPSRTYCLRRSYSCG